MEELYAYLAIIICMGISPQRSIEDYWSPTFISSHPSIRKAMSVNRFQNLSRWLHISDPEHVQRDSVFDKLQPLSDDIESRLTKPWFPGRDVAVDECMQCFTGRSSDTLTIPSKPIPTGYKIWSICDQGYTLSWAYHQKGKGPFEVESVEGLCKTASVVIHLLDRLPKSLRYYVFLDNLFTSHDLFVALEKRGYGACGTARINSGMVKSLIDLKKQESKKDLYAWGSRAIEVSEDNVMQFAWKDNAMCLFQSTIHTGEGSIIRKRKRPSKTSSKAKSARIPFGDEPQKNLPIPTFVDDYNHHMNAVDRSDHLRANSNTTRRNYKGWKSLFHWLLNVVLVNAFLLSKHQGGFENQVDFRIALHNALIEHSQRQTLKGKRRSSTINKQRSMKLPIRPQVGISHQLERRLICQTCEACNPLYVENRAILGEISGNQKRKRTCYGCSVCDVPLCKEGSCWVEFHKRGGE